MLGLLFSFQGRAGRRAYVCMFVGSVVIGCVLGLIAGDSPVKELSPGLSMAVLVFALASTWISLAVGTKRLHDLGKSGWWQLLGLAALLPLVVSPILAFVFPPLVIVATGVALIMSLWSLWIFIQMVFFPGESGSNDYGDSPKLQSFEREFAANVPEMAAAPAARMARTSAVAEPARSAAVERRKADAPREAGAPDRRRPQGFGRRMPA
jgi:uncharacterized membrane protein YhaH (DUF805 family)